MTSISRVAGGLAAVMILVLAPSGASAQTLRATGELRLDRPGATIAPEVYGQFMEQLGTGIDGGVWVGEGSDIPNVRGFRTDVVEALKALKVPVVRWPGGCYADIYHWRDGIGPRAERPVTLNRWWGGNEEANGFGTHEFFEFAELIGAKTYLSINVGSGTPAEAADWVEYISSPTRSRLAELRRANGRAEPWRIDYLGLGNEPWGCGGRMRASYYADLMRQYVGFVAPYGERTTMVAAGPTSEDYDWTRTLMPGRENFDALSLHYYTLPTGDWGAKGSALGFDEAQWAGTFVQTYRIEEMIAGHDAIMDETDPEARVVLAVDEWGAWYDPTPGSQAGHLQQQNSLRDALLAAVNFNIFHRHADRVRLANVAQMVNVLQAMILTDGPAMVLTPTYHAFAMYQPFQGATVLPLSIESPAYGALEAVDGTAARGLDGKVHVALVNLDPNRPVEVSLAVAGGAAHRVSGRILTGAVMDAHNDFDAPRVVEPAAFSATRISEGRLVVSLPAKSLVILTLD
ncbi:alpha-N-arabinofuranosidase [Brevundimonas sp.]|uniref:alpha-N-arabinofuranosidase n=1 Tax=Brevundimonas sp. TaxID=1871086 RepID=UPI002737C8CC|nr:alpha-L-arabinofuranosidase C-terminal domain-containing protein [Brevundimonas sp.]MDP3801904.1 alpha-L-arabinofuranosidase C-terminal domain-containing protein [Brevundimonas sp.]